VPDTSSPVYWPSTNGPLRQGELITGLTHFFPEGYTAPDGSPDFSGFVYGYSVALSPDCDLARDYESRTAAGRSTRATDSAAPTNIFFCEVFPSEDLRTRNELRTEQWKRLKQNNDFRYQFLRSVLPEQDALRQGLPDLAIDFRSYFTIPSHDVYKQIEIKTDVNRRCVLTNPYLEHLTSRFAAFFARVALPVDHWIKEPDVTRQGPG
jgi:hypothetical protein